MGQDKWSYRPQISIRHEKTSRQRGGQGSFFPKVTPRIKAPFNEMTETLCLVLVFSPKRRYVGVEFRRADGLDTYVQGY